MDAGTFPDRPKPRLQAAFRPIGRKHPHKDRILTKMDRTLYLPASDGLLARKSGEWAKRKHYYLNNYCGITTVSMRNRFKLVFLDVMAGPGLCKIEETGEEFPGSPFVALQHDFSEYIFIEADAALVDALKQRV